MARPTSHVYRVRPGADPGYEMLNTGIAPHEPIWEERRIARRPRYINVRDGPSDWPTKDPARSESAPAAQVDEVPDPWPGDQPF